MEGGISRWIKKERGLPLKEKKRGDVKGETRGSGPALARSKKRPA